MFEHKKIQNLDDFFLELGKRPQKTVYFYRINGFNEEISQFIQKYYETAIKTGVVIESKIPNPTEGNLSYYQEIMGLEFKMDLNFINTSLKKWLPRMNEYQRQNVSVSMYDSLEQMKRMGKNENVLKNAYIKMMCWLYYKFERIVNQLGMNNIPKILYQGDISNHELMLISILSKAGCDVVLLQYNGDTNYLKMDAGAALSDCFETGQLRPFPTDFNIEWIRKEQQKAYNTEKLYGKRPEMLNCTNVWISGKGLSDVKMSITQRGNDPKLFYNAFIRINGTEDKVNYINELYQFYLELKNTNRKTVIVNGSIPAPEVEEINSIKRGNYASQEQMLMDLTKNIQYTANSELQRLMIKAFIDEMLNESKKDGVSLNKLTGKAVYILCWLKRYQQLLFSNWRAPEIACFIYMGGCRSENEAAFIRLLARLPVDVIILKPNLNLTCCLMDNLLYEINNTESLSVDVFPQDNSNVQFGTAAYHAERELDTLMYQDTGMYRNHQYSKANSITLQTMYEEISILWKEDLKYRPNFATVDGVVNMPVIFSKVSGVKDRDVSKYWTAIKELATDETYIIKASPFIDTQSSNSVKAYAAQFFKNGKLQRAKIKEHTCYKYGFLREDIQEHILDKLQLLIDNRIIKGTFENGTEYSIISNVLNLPIEIVRLIQNFDFTKKNPKLIYFNGTEKHISLEDSIFVAFLNLVGFDIIFFVPTGYQSVEKYFNKRIMEEHQLGEYIYDLQMPDLKKISAPVRRLRDIIFGRS